METQGLYYDGKQKNKEGQVLRNLVKRLHCILWINRSIVFLIRS